MDTSLLATLGIVILASQADFSYAEIIILALIGASITGIWKWIWGMPVLRIEYRPELASDGQIHAAIVVSYKRGKRPIAIAQTCCVYLPLEEHPIVALILGADKIVLTPTTPPQTLITSYVRQLNQIVVGISITQKSSIPFWLTVR